jgi:tetratricopeptide (TPR) repeat protein
VTGARSWTNIFTNDFWGQNIRLPDSHKSYRPITVLSFRLDHEIYGLNAFGFHLTNVIIYAATCIAFYKLSKHWLSNTGAKLAGFVFALHPIHVESVASVVGRGDCLSGLFYILAILAYQHTLDSNELWSLFAAWLCAMLSTFSKEIGFTIFAMFCGLEILHQVHAVMRQHPDFRWLRVTGDLVRKKGNIMKHDAMEGSQVSYLFNHPDDLLTGLLQKNNWNKSLMILKTAVNSRLNIFSTAGANGKSGTNNTNKLASLPVMQLPPSTSFGSSNLKITVRSLPMYTWFRILLHTLTILLFFQFRSWLHGAHYMYKWTLMENHVALMPKFFPDRVLSYAQYHFWYFWKFVYPRHLCFDYGYDCVPVVTSLWDWRNLLPLVVYLLIAGAIFHAVYNLRLTLLFGWALWLSALLPAMNIVMPVGNLLAERLMFVPSIGFCIVLAEYITVDLCGVWYHSESFLWAFVEELELFYNQLRRKISAASKEVAPQPSLRDKNNNEGAIGDSKTKKKQKGPQPDTVNHPHNSHHNHHLPTHPLQHRKFQPKDNLSVSVTTANDTVSLFICGDSVTDGEVPSEAADNSECSSDDNLKELANSQGSKVSHVNNEAAKQIVTKLKRETSTENCFSMSLLLSWRFWVDSSIGIFQRATEAGTLHCKTHPSTVRFQGRMSLFLVTWPVLVLAMMRIVSRNLDWRSEFSIYTSALSVCPHSLKALSNTVVLMSAKPEYNHQALQYADLSVELYQNNSIGFINQGLAHQRQGNVLAAIMAMERSLVAGHPAPTPKKAEGYLSFALYKWAMSLPPALSVTGREEDDIRQNLLRQAHNWAIKGINSGFQSALMFYNAAAMASELKEFDMAVTLYEYAIQKQRLTNEQRLQSGNTLPFEDSISLCFAYNMYGLALSLAGRFEDAIGAFQTSISLHGQEAGCTDPMPAIINLAQMLNHHMKRHADARSVIHQYLRQYHYAGSNNSSSNDNSSSSISNIAQECSLLNYSYTILPPENMPADSWPSTFGTPADWDLLFHTELSTPPIIWNNLGFIEEQLGHDGVALEYYSRGLHILKRIRLNEGRDGGTLSATKRKIFTSEMDYAPLISPDLPAILSKNWRTLRQRLNMSVELPDDLKKAIQVDFII